MSEQETSQTVTPVELEIVYQDEYFVAVNKPAGMLVHRSWLDKHETQFVMQTLRDQIGQHVFPLHRLDRPTSGVLVFALSSEVASQVMPMFAEHKMEKTYHAIVRGWIEEEGVLDYALKVELDKIADKFASQEKEAQEAVTAYKPLAKVEVPYPTGKFPTTRYCLMEMKPKTGRKHQLRRHMAHLRHPIVGDTSHGDGKHNKLFRNEFDSHRLLLHASELRFVHPFTNEELVMKASIDDTWQQLFTRFEWDEELVK
ncbi:tRNA pseudouridine(65) synthase TruC [Vibrio parahaemolyticus]|uniref:tRNA pseudouridine(65) synthase TruC n=1 Tax=Vibrio parahaemolyticus TaxID=670 RepID=UPI000401D7E5|nr:tRNA pseudouridine(65) synthase TruC [Vibrio parahaemolyticus]EHH2418488.1 tRNA pseudouridine(65) synthase TruC [Vibrio parahaemolyticus]EIA1495238.1 tRNA pseudouridine(65) synthase TruC [Vibrio parahaemolyticus]EIO4606090.1 tRNA pseudouridine(65) synthase TruC [Vibrio parahaemolyticus]EJG1818289.1 tRNA pseudouridine(65) synthase TruC [Vibrio parahaemolyticus]EJG2228754.1 tRNA pseudouridine(65) synthase TruC [Vibrio parahaemolyticus]